jgi:hypothetical protein
MIVDWIDDTERKLIVKFFGVDPVQVIDSETTCYHLGQSTFRNIIEFYKFEYKPHEKEFWDMMYPTTLKLPDKTMSLEMAQVDVGYFWLDYVTPVNIKYDILSNHLIIDIERKSDPYDRALVLICNMMFVSDFNEVKPQYRDIDTRSAWSEVLKQTKEFSETV